MAIRRSLYSIAINGRRLDMAHTPWTLYLERDWLGSRARDESSLEHCVQQDAFIGSVALVSDPIKHVLDEAVPPPPSVCIHLVHFIYNYSIFSDKPIALDLWVPSKFTYQLIEDKNLSMASYLRHELRVLYE
jgi:hypothetical protein